MVSNTPSTQNESVIQMISDYVVFLLDQALDNFSMKDMEAEEPPVTAEIKLVTTLDKPEDLLVYCCYIAHKLSNNSSQRHQRGCPNRQS